MVLRVVLRGNLVAHAACHRHGAQARRTNQRIDLLLREEIHQLHEQDTARDGQGKGQETSGYDADGCPVQESLARHRGTHTEAQEDGGGIHNAVGGGVEQATRVRTDFLDEVTEHQHTNQRHSRRHKQGHDGRHGYREDNLQYAQVLDFSLRRIELLLLLHVDHQLLLSTEQLHNQRDDDRH